MSTTSTVRGTFEERDDNREAVNLLLTISSSLNRGDVFRWEEMESAVGFTREFSRFMYIVRKFRTQLRKLRGIACRPIVGIGLRFLTESEQVRRCSEDRHRKMFRQSTMAMREIEAVEQNSLSLVDRRLRFMSLDRLRDERKQIRSVVKQLTNARKENGMPLRKLKDNS